MDRRSTVSHQSRAGRAPYHNDISSEILLYSQHLERDIATILENVIISSFTVGYLLTSSFVNDCQ